MIEPLKFEPIQSNDIDAAKVFNNLQLHKYCKFYIKTEINY